MFHPLPFIGGQDGPQAVVVVVEDRCCQGEIQLNKYSNPSQCNGVVNLEWKQASGERTRFSASVCKMFTEKENSGPGGNRRRTERAVVVKFETVLRTPLRSYSRAAVSGFNCFIFSICY